MATSNKIYDYLKLDFSKVITINDWFYYVKDYTLQKTPLNLSDCSINYSCLKRFHFKLDNITDEKAIFNILYIEKSINDLREQIDNNDLSHSKLDGNSFISKCINGYLEAYYKIMNQLNCSLIEQTDSIMSYGQAYIDMSEDENHFTGGIIEKPIKRVYKLFKTLNIRRNISPNPGDTCKTQGGGSRGGSTGGGSPGN